MEDGIHPPRRGRSNNEGSIKKCRDGRWEAQYSCSAFQTAHSCAIITNSTVAPTKASVWGVTMAIAPGKSYTGTTS